MDDHKELLNEVLFVGDVNHKYNQQLHKNTSGLKEAIGALSEPLKTLLKRKDVSVPEAKPPIVNIPDTIRVQNFPKIQDVKIVNNPKSIELTKVEKLLKDILGGLPEKKGSDLQALILNHLEIKKAKTDKQILEALVEIKDRDLPMFELPMGTLSKDNRIKVEVDRAGGSGGQVIDGFGVGKYDSMDLTYVAAGNGAGEVETVTYKKGGDTVATLTLTYDASDNVASVTRV